ncbi:TIGR03013 family XrtA/PEP-CTERM system glycosyltransferase [Geoalkalibacter halelectricus]|uniref:TIGR03013 family XrtA/PEP-CTERM system glycosyltransferase n=1 Tax=Geoalkalibacter halelectricus TaxID=2847045 RepID=UPI002670087D|nr:TIGR03013 family XrtA/PEP-CTERM system glycosyltransferase [Geoalkalibacter halelectricus]MDO3379696.1 TIGR03013 family PEP-CTERM/XrtA system glycosyltransferase [Geoalkalibacter halelectricus]
MSKSLAILMLIDLVLAANALVLATLLRLGKLGGTAEHGFGWPHVIVFALVLMLCGFFVELYNRDREFSKTETAVRIGVSLIVGFFALSALYYMFPDIHVGRGILLMALALFGIGQFIWHHCHGVLLSFPGIAQRVVILGNGSLGQKIEEIMPSVRNNYVFAGYIRPSQEAVCVPEASIVGNVDEIFDAVSRVKAHKIVVSLAERRGVLPVREILRCKLSGVEVVDALNFYEQLTGKLLVENINPSWFIFSNGFRVTRFIRCYKRVLDILFSTTGILLSLPLFPFIALAIKLDSRGQVFFRQNRVGEGEKEFMLYKFRTMTQDAEKNGAVWARENDPRVTRIGNFLRKTRLDEIPQLLNVLKGDMSFVGPRPERPEFVKMLEEKIPYYSKRHFVKPGVTGWAQVKYPYGASVEDALEKLRYDLYYIKNISVFMDILIVLETIKVVLFGRGAR